MRYKIYVGSSCFITETEKPVNFCLIGRLDEAKEKPQEAWDIVTAYTMDRSKPKPTQEQLDLANAHLRRGRKRYSIKPIEWFETEEQAEAAKANWPDYIDFRIQPVEVRIP